MQESVRTKHPQLLYESKLYRILQGGSESICVLLKPFFNARHQLAHAFTSIIFRLTLCSIQLVEDCKVWRAQIIVCFQNQHWEVLRHIEAWVLSSLDVHLRNFTLGARMHKDHRCVDLWKGMHTQHWCAEAMSWSCILICWRKKSF